MSRKEEVEEELGELNEKLSEAEEAYGNEEDEKRAELLWRKIRRFEKRIEKLIEKMEELENALEEEEETEEEEDEECCPNCGSDLVEVGRDRVSKNRVFQCEKCHGWYEEE